MAGDVHDNPGKVEESAKRDEEPPRVFGGDLYARLPYLTVEDEESTKK